MEEQEINEAEKQIDATLLKDEVFKKFCKLLVYANDKFERRAIEERFGIWLQMNSEKSEALKKDYQKFEQEIREDLNKSKVIQNPCYYIQRGKKFADSSKKHILTYQQAIHNFTTAIELDNEFAENAYYNRAMTLLERHCQKASFFDFLEAPKTEKLLKAEKDFIEARNRLKNRMNELTLILQANSFNRNGSGNVLSDQISRKLMLLNIQKGTIEQAIGMSDEDYNQQLNAFDESIKKIKDEFEKIEQSKRNYDEHKKQLETQEEKKKDFINKNPKEGIIQKVIAKGTDIKFQKFSIRQLFPEEEKIKLYGDELNELAINGFTRAFDISELPPIDW